MKEAYYKKVGLLLLSEDKNAFLVCEKDNFTSDFIMPGGQLEEGESDLDCLSREIEEELAVELDRKELEYVGEYIDVAAGDETKNVSIRLYKGNVIGIPRPSQEIVELHWIGKDGSPRLSSIIRNKILPDIIERKILM